MSDAETALKTLIKAVHNLDYSNSEIVQQAADFCENFAPSLLAEREKDRARIERLEKALVRIEQGSFECAILYAESGQWQLSYIELQDIARAALTDTRAPSTTEAQNG